jgi:hypothetical protein
MNYGFGRKTERDYPTAELQTKTTKEESSMMHGRKLIAK